MHFAPQGLLSRLKPPLRAWSTVLIQIRTATKRVSLSKTNMKDSAGRRLGPKKFESSFVKPGQIIIRQRGTKIHPGDNVGLGKDHTIFALEPGYVRFYLDPFHPRRKYVGVSLKKDVMLPYPHFLPRLRRFGYDVLTGKQAEQEESRMSRKEELAQPKLRAEAEEKSVYDQKKIDEYIQFARSIPADFSKQELELGAERLLFIGKHLANDTLLEKAAADQASFNYLHDVYLAMKRNGSTAEEFESTKSAYLEFAEKFDQLVSVDFSEFAFSRLSEETLAAKQRESRAKLQELFGNKVSAKDFDRLEAIIAEPGVFDRDARHELREQYFVKVLPATIPGTVVEVAEGQKPPKNAVCVRTFDPKTRTLLTVYRTKDSFLSID